MRNFVFIITLFILSTGCNEKSKNENVLQKFCGAWKLDGKNEFEEWNKAGEGYISRMYSVNNSDTVFTESVKIYPVNGRWNFETIVKNQNEGKAVIFEQSEISAKGITFTNPTHDFPKTIHYELVSDKILQAYIAGSNDTIAFHFSRVK